MAPMQSTTPASNQTRAPLSLRRRHGAPCAAEAREGASAPGGRQPMKAEGSPSEIVADTFRRAAGAELRRAAVARG